MTDTPAMGAYGLSRWLLGHARRRSRGMVAVLATMLGKIAIDLLKPWPMKVVVDHALGDRPAPGWIRNVAGLFADAGPAHALLYAAVGATVLVFLAGWALGAASSLASVRFGQRIAYDLAADLFAHLQRLSLRFHSQKPTGDSIRRVTTDTRAVTTIVRDALLPAISSMAFVVAMLVVLAQLDLGLTVVALLVVPLVVLALRRYSAPMVDAGYRAQEVSGRVYDVVERTLAAVPVVQAFTREDDADAELRRATTQTLGATIETTRVQYKYKFATGLSMAIGTGAVTWFGATQVLDGRLSLGSMLVFLSYLASLYAPLEALAYTSSTIQGAVGSARRVKEVLDADPDIRERPHAPALPRIRGHVRFEGVTVGYEPDRAVLRDVSFDALPGQTVAIVGKTGAGKSTLVAMIPRLLDAWAGRISIDGHDVRGVTIRSLRDQVSIVLQEPLLFPITIAENIAYGKPEATRQEIEAAAIAANAHEFIYRLPSGYDTLVGQRGLTLSGGERQRLSIARAILRDAPILILDEPTSALDAETEASLMEALRRLMAGRTTFVIAHRSSTIRGSDRVFVVSGGTVQERPPDDVSAGDPAGLASSAPKDGPERR
jgi:ATP-binding cassette, subfamily B, bacterial